MTSADGPPAHPGADDGGPGGHLDEPLLPASRVVADASAAPAPAPAGGIGDEDLGQWFDSVERSDLDAREALRQREQLVAERSRRREAARQTPASRIQVHVIAAVAALVAAFAPGAPTGLPWWDLLLRVGFAYLVVVAAAQARRWTWIVMAGIAAAASRDLAPVAMAWSGLAVALAAAVFDFRRRRVGAVVGALAVNALLRLAPIGVHGFTAVLVVAAVAPVLASAYLVQRHRVRRRIRVVALGTGGAVLLAVVALGIVGALGAGHVAAGQEAASRGLDAAKAGEQDESAIQFAMANDEFADAEGLLASWAAAPSRLVPWVGYQSDALASMSAIGHDLTGTAEQVTTRADYRRIASVDGRIDVAEISAWAGPLAEVEAALVAAEGQTEAIETDWLAAPILDRFHELDQQVTDALDEARVARQAVAVAPDLLGANGVRRYFIAFTTPAESRGLGGFMGNWAILEANDGRLDLVRKGRSSELARRPGDPERTLTAPQDYLDRYGPLEPELQFRDITFSPDFPSDAQAISGVFPQTVGGAPIDGVLALDPYAIAALLEITGPQKVEGLDFELTADNAADYLLREQYLKFDPAEQNGDRKDVLAAASETTFEAFIDQPSYRPSQLAAVLGPVVAERRFLAYSAVPAEEALVERLGLDGAFPTRGDGDFFSLVTQNGGNNKIDVYLRRAIDYDVTVDPTTGALSATATITLRNDAPSSGMPDYVIANRPSSGQPKGVNWTWFNFYTPHLLTGATIDGRPLAVGEQREFGMRVYQTYLPVPAQGEAVVVLDLTGSVAAGPTYDVDWFQQPLVNTDEVSVTVQASEGGEAGAGSPTTAPPVTITRSERTDQRVSARLVAP